MILRMGNYLYTSYIIMRRAHFERDRAQRAKKISQYHSNQFAIQ